MNNERTRIQVGVLRKPVVPMGHVNLLWRAMERLGAVHNKGIIWIIQDGIL